MPERTLVEMLTAGSTSTRSITISSVRSMPTLTTPLSPADASLLLAKDAHLAPPRYYRKLMRVIRALLGRQLFLEAARVLGRTLI